MTQQGTRPLMIFHAPYPLAERAAASRLRPLRMRQAFAALGYEVVEVTGYAPARRRAMARALARLDAYARQRAADPSLPTPFVYSENATIPSALTEPGHLPPHPFLDISFFRQASRRGARVGAFYRDLYWRFPRFRQDIHPVVDAALRATYLAELRQWQRAGLRVYLPSAAMAPHMPVIDRQAMSALPPGADLVSRPAPDRAALVAAPGAGMDLLFIGVLGDNYHLEPVCQAVAQTEGTHLTLCTRPESWQTVAEHYRPLLPQGRHRVVHAYGPQLEPLYSQAAVGVLLVEPSEYWDFAVPYKLYEYLAHELPVVATAGTQAGRIVQELGIGWTLPAQGGALAALLRHLRANPGELAQVQARMRLVLPGQTWQARARQVALDLSGWAPEPGTSVDRADLQGRDEGEEPG
ncbi:glycosyltransferase [Actinomyces faecalis]|uniref:glycosyltransferase n=1 Tax=Actinomyces faecalis TaxID=2722820 RepID=UPI001F2520DC|nr:glycosyltransferase [Actinomyces faecalis]